MDRERPVRSPHQRRSGERGGINAITALSSGDGFMKSLITLLFVLLLAASPAYAQWKANDEHAEDTPDRKAVNGFGGQLIVVENPRAFIQEWLKPETPKIKSATNVKRGDALGAFVLFAGCKIDAQG